MAGDINIIADDLDQLLNSIKPKPVVKPSVAQEQDTSIVARALVEYVLHKAPENCTAESVGGALSVGIDAASKELGINKDKLMDAVESYMMGVLGSAKLGYRL